MKRDARLARARGHRANGPHHDAPAFDVTRVGEVHAEQAVLRREHGAERVPLVNLAEFRLTRGDRLGRLPRIPRVGDDALRFRPRPAKQSVDCRVFGENAVRQRKILARRRGLHKHGSGAPSDRIVRLERRELRHECGVGRNELRQMFPYVRRAPRVILAEVHHLERVVEIVPGVDRFDHDLRPERRHFVPEKHAVHRTVPRRTPCCRRCVPRAGPEAGATCPPHARPWRHTCASPRGSRCRRARERPDCESRSRRATRGRDSDGE